MTNDKEAKGEMILAGCLSAAMLAAVVTIIGVGATSAYDLYKCRKPVTEERVLPTDCESIINVTSAPVSHRIGNKIYTVTYKTPAGEVKTTSYHATHATGSTVNWVKPSPLEEEASR